MNAIFLATNLSDTVRETGEAFGWDPKLFFSQVISFIIVAYLLKRFAYKPILGVLEQRRQQIAQAHLNAEKIKQQLAEAEQRHAEILAKANAEAQKMIEEARSSSWHLADRKQQEAIAAADQILAKAREASAIEHERTMAQLKRELGRPGADTTAKVRGKAQAPDDHRGMQEKDT